MLSTLRLHLPKCSELHSVYLPIISKLSEVHSAAPVAFVFPPSTSSLTPCNTFYLHCFPKSAPTVKNNCFLSEVLTLPLVSQQNLMHSLLKLNRLWPSTPGHFQGQAIRLQTWSASPSCFHKSLLNPKFSQENQCFHPLTLSSLTYHV